MPYAAAHDDPGWNYPTLAFRVYPGNGPETVGVELKLVSRYEDGRYLESNPTWHEQDSPLKAQWIAGLLQLAGMDPGSILEVGCGAGGIVRALKRIYPRSSIEGWDISPQAIELAERGSGEDVCFHSGNLLESSWTCDTLLAIDVLEHMEDPFQFLRACQGRVRRIVAHFPLDLSVQTVIRGGALGGRRRKLGHIHFFTRELALDLLRENGWVPIAERYTPSALDLPLPDDRKGRIKNWLLRIPRRLIFPLAPHFAARLLGGWCLLVIAVPENNGDEPIKP